MKRSVRFVLAISLLASACRTGQSDELTSPGRWQVVANPVGPTVLTDTATGDTWSIHYAQGTYRWKPIPRAEPSIDREAQANSTASEPVLTVDRAIWWDDPHWSPEVRAMLKDRPALLLHVADDPDYLTTFKPITVREDLRFSLDAHGHPSLSLKAMTGGVTVGPEVYATLPLQEEDLNQLETGVEYTVSRVNVHPGARLRVAEAVRVVRR